ncbi:MAG: sporulation protein YqfD [Limnochordales bacterium]
MRALSSLFRGYVIIRAKGGRLEAFVNRAVAQGIALWRLERVAPHLLVARVAASDFPRVARAGRRLGVHVVILHKAGLPFLLLRAGRRPAFVAGGALLAALLYVLGQFVWFVRVEGVQALPPHRLLAVAAEAGLRPGVLRDLVRRDVVERRLYLEIPQLAWTAVEIRGTVATVRVVERTELEAGQRQPGHIVAVRDGVVEQAAALRGEVLVTPGETVRAGQPLISGMLPPGSAEYQEHIARGQLPYVRAAGVVRGRTWYRGLAEAPLVRVVEEDTGRRHRYGILRLGRWQLRLGRTAAPFAAARWEEHTRSLAALPGLSWTWHVAYEVRRWEEPVGAAQARAEAVAQARAQAAAQLPAGGEILDEQVTVTEDRSAGVVRAMVTLEVLQDLGRFAPIGAGPDGQDG